MLLPTKDKKKAYYNTVRKHTMLYKNRKITVNYQGLTIELLIHDF